MPKDDKAGSGSGAALARRVDPDRFLTALPAPLAKRDALFTLIAFNHELVRALEMPSMRSGSGPIAALIRLQWWREVVEGARNDWHAQPVAIQLRALLDDGAVRPDTLLGLVAARESEAEGIQTLDEWRSAMRSGAGGVQQAIGQVLGIAPEHGNRLAAVGAAYGTGALRRHLPAILASGRYPLPEEMLEQAGTSQERRAQDAALLPALRDALKREGGAFLRDADGPPLPGAQRAALLPLVLARRDLAREDGVLSHAPRDRGLGDRFAVLAASMLPAGRSGAIPH